MVQTALVAAGRRSSHSVPCARELREETRPTDAPSSRPTSIPAFDVEAFAVASLTNADSPDPRAVPARTKRAMAVAGAFSLRQGFVFFHIDGRSSIAEIAAATGMPARELIACFHELAALGAVHLTMPA